MYVVNCNCEGTNCVLHFCVKFVSQTHVFKNSIHSSIRVENFTHELV